MSKEHGKVRSKAKVSHRIRLKRLSCESKLYNGTNSELSRPGDLGEPIREGESQMPKKEATHQPQFINKFHNLDC